MKARNMLVEPNPKLRARRKSDTEKAAAGPAQRVVGIDMPTIMIEGFALGGNIRRPADR
jgi:hypothetical protein